MIIDELEILHVALDLNEPWKIAVSAEDAVESVLVRLRTGDHEVWAEATPHALPQFCPDWAGATFALLCKVTPAVLDGTSSVTAAELQAQLDRYRGNFFAKAALDVAWWTAQAALDGQPLHVALGAERDYAPVGADFGIQDSHERLIELMTGAVAAGYRRVKLKICPGWDLKMLDAVRAAFPDLPIQVDANGAYSLDEHRRTLLALDEFELTMIEQPLQHDDLLDHATLQSLLATPICLDESIVSLRHLEQAIAIGSCQIVNVKPGRVGGLTPARAIVERCIEANLGCWIGGMIESDIGAAACLALACTIPLDYPSDVFPSDRFFRRALASPQIAFETDAQLGRIARTTDAPGLPQAPDPDLLAACTLQRAIVHGG